MRHIYNTINWDIFPAQDKMVRVTLSYSANENGVVDDVEVIRGYNELYDTEAIRVIKSIPEWDIFFSRGRLVRMRYVLTIFFSEEYRLKYKEK